MIVGAAMSKATGGNPQLGAFIAMNAIKNNELYTKEELQELLRDSDWGEQFCKIKGIEPTPENIAKIQADTLAQIKETEDLISVQAYMVYGSGGLTKGIGLGAGVLFDTNGNPYVPEDVDFSKGISTPLSGEICALTIIRLDSNLELDDATIINILRGESIGITVYAGVGGGLSTPVDSKYQGKVLILKRGFGTPQIGIGGGVTETIEDIITRRKEGPYIED